MTMTMSALKLDAEAAQNIADTFAGCRALILEDEIGAEMKAALEAAGCESVDLFETGDAALEALEREAYDVLVLDRINPGIEGLEVLDRVRRRPNGLKTDPDVPALVYSLLGGEDQRLPRHLAGRVARLDPGRRRTLLPTGSRGPCHGGRA